MKKVLSVMAVSAFVLTAGVALAGGPGKKADSCPAPCQQQIDDLNSSQAQQNEQLGAHGKQLKNHEGRITALEKAENDPWYVRVGARAAWMQQDLGGFNEVDSEVGFGGAIAFGREFTEWNYGGKFRAEIELAYQGADIDEANRPDATGNEALFNAEYNLMTVMVNGYYAIPVADAFSVYAMAGVGYAKYEAKGESTYTLTGDTLPIWTDRGDESDNVFAYKAGFGMSYEFTEMIAGDLGYEYLGVADTNIAESINGHNVVGSVRFKF